MKKDILQISYDKITNRGERQINEDYVGGFIHKNKKYFVLCDGLGGHGNGDIASKFVVNTIHSAICERNMTMEEGIDYAQERLLQKQKMEGKEDSMKTTLTVLELSDRKARFAYVGDSRVYWFQKGKYKLRSRDHSVPQMLLNNGEISEKEIRHHVDRSRLLRVMGTPWNKPKYDVIDNIVPDKNSSFLLCSDGFWELVEEKEMSHLLKKSESPGQWLSAMETVVREKGRGTNMDNYSAIAVFVR